MRRFNDEEWAAIRSIFDKRGVSREVAEGRPYVPYQRGAEWVTADAGPFATIPLDQRRSTVLVDVRGADGLLMYKHPVPLSARKLAWYPPQLRPTPNPVTGSIVNHDHTDPWVKRRRKKHVRERHPESDVEGMHDNFFAEEHKHADYSRLAREEHVAGRAHHGVDTEDPHPNGEPGKYKLPPSPLAWATDSHEHPRPVRTIWTDRRGVRHEQLNCRHRPTCVDDAAHTAWHVKKAKEHRHGNVPLDGVQHPHLYRDKDPLKPSYGKRLDVHPLGVPLLELTSTEAVFISMEGNLKADSILTYILKHDRPWAAADIPSVGQWRAEELDDFADEHLAGRQVFLVCDSDWAHPSKFDVQRQAFAFREYLRRKLGSKQKVQVACAPEPAERDEWGDPQKVGVDDWLADKKFGGYGGKLEGLIVVERDIGAAMCRWAEQYAQPAPGQDVRRLKSQARVISLMSLISNPNGEGHASISSLAGFISMKRGTVSGALGEGMLEHLESSIAGSGGPLPPGLIKESPLEYLNRKRVLPRRNYRLAKALGVTSHDTLEWCIRDGYRWHDRTPRRTVGELLRRS